MAVTLNGTNGLTFNDGTSQKTAASGFGFKNRIINGDMRIDQRNNGASVTPGTGTYTVDRWTGLNSVASKYTVQQNAGSVTPPAGFTNYLGVTSSSAYTVSSTDYFGIVHRIEGFNIADLGWGTSGASSVALSFWVRSSLTGTFGGSLTNSAENYSYPFSFSIPAANTWTQVSVVVPGPTTGTWLSNSGTGIELWISLGGGSTRVAAAGSWTAAFAMSCTGATNVVSTNGATFYITGVQLEKGSTATSFDYRPYGFELQLCQRYAQVLTSVSVGRTTASSVIGAAYMAPVLFRAAPTASNISYTLSTGVAGTPATYGASVNGIEFYNSAGNWTVAAQLQVSATLSAEL